MEDKNILNLVNKFEKSINETEKLTNALLGLEDVLEKLDTSINEIYELTKVESLSDKSDELVENLNKLKVTQAAVNKEYSELINLSLYKDNIKEEVLELKNYLLKIDYNVNDMKNHMDEFKRDVAEENRIFKEELLNIIRESHSNKK
ncbi:MAG: hypothetical protein ACRC92_10235 [Peptostreptococcaceae bacterium]